MPGKSNSSSRRLDWTRSGGFEDCNFLGGQKMAKSGRITASSSGNSISKRRKAVERRQATRPALQKSAKNKDKAARAAALLVEDEFNNLRAAHRAYACVQSFLTPSYLQEIEEFRIQPIELSALMEVVNAEMVRRMQTVTDAIQSVR
ncbi:MAG TPA: hypothetical protein VGH84_12950, partial [Steroidobacteraceae bacterium]